ncbi:hypothetical protein MB02_13240 [Croceicoccus estronivorus]|uniref:alpha/beta hydrolase n=1 Tax=Croceicoccus estronivorus TaxID=1172626 RepID=UPI00082BCBE5|nr:alpha/beta hydrolase [Croceicoccus estronivorus]OCC23127.1 hypothetical protein MB02_13240 [Croceicoccus estronivorus]
MNVSSSYVREDVRAFLMSMEGRANGLIPGDDLPLARAAFSQMLAQSDTQLNTLATIREFSCAGPTGPLRLRLYHAHTDSKGREEGPVILYFHGGGFMLGDLDSYDSLCSEIAVQTNLPLVAVDYPLAPEHPFPAAPNACAAAAYWVAQQHPELAEAIGAPLSGLILMGDSAGGNLAIVTAQALSARPAMLPVAMQVPVYPLTGPIGDHESYRAFRSGHFLTREAMFRFHSAYAAPMDDPRHYPILHTGAQMPPTLLVTAALDPLRDSGREYGTKLAGTGTPLQTLEIAGMIHGFMTLRKAIPSAQKDLEIILQTMTQMLERYS